MPTIAAGSAATETLTVAQSISITCDPAEVLLFDVRRSGVLVAGGRARSTQVIGPFSVGDVVTLTAQRGSVDYTLIQSDEIPRTSLTVAQAAGVADLTYRKAGNLTTGVGADLVFSGAGGAGAGKLNTGVDLLIPANTLVAGTSQLRFNVNVRKTGTDLSFLVVRFGTTNGASDGSTGAAIQFTAANPQDAQLQCVLNVSASTLSLQGQYFVPGVTQGTAFATVDLGSLNFAVDNYLSFNISGATTSNNRVTGYEVEVFQ